MYDPGLARHYYWNTESDEVCWLSPTHPKAVIGEAAPKMGKAVRDKARQLRDAALSKAVHIEAIKAGGRRVRLQDADDQFGASRGRGRTAEGDEDSEGDDEDGGGRGKKRPVFGEEEKEVPDHIRLRRAKRKGIDPMDPSAYSDTPRGGWGAGLNQVAEAKTGVDVTASGPLFQSRPYPAPGAVLRKNAEAKKDHQSDFFMSLSRVHAIFAIRCNKKPFLTTKQL